MDLPCRCGKQYQHGRCESLRTPGPVEFTEAYVRKVAEVLCQEFSYGSLLKECEGLSELPESFGNGESCTCGESKIRDFHMTCANCISGREELGYHNDEATETPQVSDSRDPKEEETQEQSMYTQSERQQAEALAAKLTRLKQYAIQESIDGKILHGRKIPTLGQCEQVQFMVIVDECSRHKIFLDIIPGEAHWKLGICEQAVQGLKEVLAKPEDRTPWTFQRVAAEIGGNQVKDYSHHKPTEREWSNAQNEEETPPPVRTRFRGKRALPASAEAPMEEDEAQPQTSTASSSRARLGEIQGCGFQVAEAWWAAIPEDHWEDRPAAYWSEEGAAVSVEIELPTNPRGLQRTLQHLPTYFVGAMKRRAVEVCERKLTEPQKEEFRNAKNVEVRNFIASKAFEVLPEELKPSREQAINMRWILTWKTTDSGGQKAKARAVLLGYQDPKYEHRATTAPVMTRQTRQMQLQISTNRGWMVQKGDVSGAFLQGREYPDQLFCVPCKEICEAMGLPEGTITRLRRACYGLVDAPLEWYRTVDEYLCELGLVRTHADACAWVWRPQGELRGMISGHVDDFLFSGRADDVQWQALLEKIRQRFKWGDWDQDKFVQCGVQVERTSEGFLLSQPHYLEGIKEIPLSSSRRKAKDAPTGEREKTQLRALLGGLSWHAQQVAPHLSAEVSLLLSEISESTVSTIIKANLLAYHAKARQDHQMLIHRFAAEEPLALFGWVDAASQNRREGGSTQGIFIGMGPANMLQGELGRVTPIAWHSNKIDRSCRSPGAAEAQAAVNGEDALYFARYQWSELCYGDVNIRHPDNTVAKVTGCLVTDSRNVYDKLQTEVLVIKGAEKRTNIELLSIKEAQRNHGVLIRWVHSEAQLANALTKHGSRELELYYRMRHSWRIVEDPEMMSARRRKTAGLEPLATGK
ncbi:Copia protein [Symbiodinium microadriaticum]|uniref:Copia protein n=1 Tax=Symbiodinium microadriaticum TaxID=2951 RepID=A0A1Q9CZM2_SYMMI|nr:Copia protein [Symbiodinium microadriaticum]